MKDTLTFPPQLLPGLRHLVFQTMGREPDVIIGTRDRPYMKRWWLKREDDESHYVHEVLRDDDDRALHDHPWPSLSILIDGRLSEVFAPEGTDPKDPLQHGYREFGVGQIVYRPATFAHRLRLPSGTKAVTLFMTGPVLRDWGFHCPKGWVFWKDFVANEDGVSTIGRGCGEELPPSPNPAVLAQARAL